MSRTNDEGHFPYVIVHTYELACGTGDGRDSWGILVNSEHISMYWSHCQCCGAFIHEQQTIKKLQGI